MAKAAIVAHHGEDAGTSPDLVRDLSVVFRRLRRSQGPDERYTSLDLERSDHRRLFEEQGRRCAVCRYLFKEYDLEAEQEGLPSLSCEGALPGEERLEKYYRAPELDHILPKFLGGDTSANWQILCRSCNNGKGEGIAWVLRRGLLPAARPSEAMKLSAALRYAVLASYYASEPTRLSTAAEGELRIFRKRQDVLPVYDNLCVGSAQDDC
ncbi:HNH endonuclease [Leptolyngbya sp. 15MV]|nr:HNH endonuclease [Leptolyngbya sp. 15MV]